MTRLLVACVLAAQAVAPPAPPITRPASSVALATVSDARLTGTLALITPAGVVSLVRASGGRATMPLEDVIEARFDHPEAVPAAEEAGALFLASSDCLRGQIVSSDKDGVGFQTRLVGEVRIPFDRLLAYVPPRRVADAAARRALLDEVLPGTTTRDLVYLANGDRIPGVVERMSADALVVSGVLGTSTYKIAQVEAVAFARPDLRSDAPKDLYAVIGLVDGSRLSARIVSMEKDVIRLAALAGFTAGARVDDVTSFRVRNGRVVPLAEVEPARVDYVPYYNRVWPMRRDASVWGATLTVAGGSFRRGLGLAPRTTLVYALDGQYERFEAKAGIDDETGGKGAAELVIRTDGREALRIALAAGRPATLVDLPLAGVKELVLVVDFGPDDDVGDHVDLAEARLIRPRSGEP